ncbi:hypothetical protein [Paenibacillus periandrae]|uniref:hypothetical protein n=1 Tax=Paenibacillus periandrae TaxID=1761741 RepID=UPI001F08B37D|nr:hypothetical protein [Paenibacillus periandrae]
MYREKMDLRIKLAVLPFVDMHFYYRDFIGELGRQRSTSDYRSYLDNTFLKELLPVLHQTERINHLDEVGMLVEKYYPHRMMNECTYFGECPEKFYLERLKELSRLLLTHRNGKIALKYWDNTDEKKNENSIFSAYRGIYKVALWNSLNRMICTDLLVMVYLISNGMKDEYVLRSYHSLVYMPDTQLDQLLNEGVAETHLHLSASGQFQLNWQAMMSPTPKTRDIVAVKSHTFIDALTGKQSDPRVYTLVAAILRLVLAAYLQSIQGKIIKGNLSISYFLEATLKSNSDKYDTPERELYRLIREILNGEDLVAKGYNSDNLYHLYEDVKVLVFTVELSDHHKEATWAQRMTDRDSLSRIFGTGITYTSPENVFMFRAVRYMSEQLEHDMLDSTFAKLFWQYIRIKNEQFTRAVQRNHIRGLPYFRDYFEKSTAQSLAQDDVQHWGFLLHHQLQNPHIKKLEVRIAPPQGNNVSVLKKSLALKLLNIMKAYREILVEFEEITPNRLAPLLGIVLHFIKMPDMQRQEKCWFDYNENERNDEKLNYKNKQIEYKKQMEAIRDLRERISGLGEYIVGIDAANLETYVEPWVFAPVFQQARNSDTHKLVYPDYPHKSIGNLGLTYHVGEDFRHMLTGIRHLDEVIEHFQFRAGDRIGHGMVLGVNVSKWATRNRVVVLPRIEMFENLLWIWGMCRDGNPLVDLDSANLENRIMKIAEAIYISINGITVYSLWKSYQSKFQEIGTLLSCIEKNTIEEWFDEQGKQEMRWTAEKLKSTYHCNCYLARMREPIEIEITREEELMIQQMQQVVQQKVSKEGIVIETNPTSNTAIGEIENIFEHYIHNLNRRGLPSEQLVERGIMVSINTDDPVVFNTNIDNEFAVIFHSLQDKGYAREDILHWIDHVRKTGLTSSFIRNRQVSLSELVSEVGELIKEMSDYLYG